MTLKKKGPGKQILAGLLTLKARRPASFSLEHLNET